jgi:hypothetical protein
LIQFDKSPWGRRSSAPGTRLLSVSIDQLVSGQEPFALHRNQARGKCAAIRSAFTIPARLQLVENVTVRHNRTEFHNSRGEKSAVTG